MPTQCVGILLVQSSLGVWEMPGKRRRSGSPRFFYLKQRRKDEETNLDSHRSNDA